MVTETCGPLAGKRVVRGREEECMRHYDIVSADPPARGEPFDEDGEGEASQGAKDSSRDS